MSVARTSSMQQDARWLSSVIEVLNEACGVGVDHAPKRPQLLEQISEIVHRWTGRQISPKLLLWKLQQLRKAGALKSRGRRSVEPLPGNARLLPFEAQRCQQRRLPFSIEFGDYLSLKAANREEHVRFSPDDDENLIQTFIEIVGPTCGTDSLLTNDELSNQVVTRFNQLADREIGFWPIFGRLTHLRKRGRLPRFRPAAILSLSQNLPREGRAKFDPRQRLLFGEHTGQATVALSDYIEPDLFEAAWSAEKAGDFAAAERYYKDLRSREHNSPVVTFNLANVIAKQCRYDAAIQWYEEALMLGPRFADSVFSNLGLCLEKIPSRADEAESCYRRALELNPLHRDAHFNLARILEQQENYAEAQQHWRIYLQFDNSSPYAEYASKRLAAFAQEQSEAVQN